LYRFARLGLERENGFHYHNIMYVCCCRAVTDREVARVIDEGAGSVDAVTRACGAGGDCGACRGMIEDMIEDRAELVAPGKLVRPKAA
jgi:bacterioferritin-associated ferredoxin